MATLYKHMHPSIRIVNWAEHKKQELNAIIAQSQLEIDAMNNIIAKFKPDICPVCNGVKTIQSYDETLLDSANHICPGCNGSGLTADADKVSP
jgi:hypothetical protein